MRMPRWRSTFGPVALVAVLLSVTALVVGFVAQKVVHETLERQLDHRVTAETAALLDEVHVKGLPGLIAGIERREASRSASSPEYLLQDAAGRTLAGEVVPLDPVHEGYEEFFHYRRGDRSGVAQAQATRVGDALLIVAADREDLAATDRTLDRLVLGSVVAMLLIGIGGAVLIGIATRRRLSRIATTAQAVIAGELSERIARDGSGDEFDRLAQVLNEMLERIGGLIDNLRQVSSDVAHDLRTPLTRLQASLELAATDEDVASARRRIDGARQQASELLETFAAVLRIAEIEGLGRRLPRQPLDLSQLVADMAESYGPDVEASGRTLVLDAAPDVRFLGDRRLLSEAIANLLDNSLRHTPRGTTLRLSLAQTADGVRIALADDGPGVDEPQPERMFQRFARSEAARSTPGHGLGLSLVAAVAAGHGGIATLHGGPGFTVTLELPHADVPLSGS